VRREEGREVVDGDDLKGPEASTSYRVLRGTRKEKTYTRPLTGGGGQGLSTHSDVRRLCKGWIKKESGGKRAYKPQVRE